MSFHKSFPAADKAWRRHTWGGSTNENGQNYFFTLYVVETAAGHLYQVFYSVNYIFYSKSTDGGLSWSLPINFGSLVNPLGVAIWYDRWSGIAAGKIHMAYVDNQNDDINYRSLDTENSDTLSAEVVIFDGATAANGQNLSITRSRGGNLYVHGVIDTGAEGGFYKSTDVGANWSSVTVNEAIASGDQIILLPGWAADDEDIMAFFWDTSANEISRQLYDDSADTWSETSIVSATDTNVGMPHFAAAVDIANSQNVLIAWTAIDTLNADLKCYTVTEGAITTKTDVVLNSTDDQGLAAIGINTTNGDWYAFYAGKSDGSETWTTSLNLYYKISTDDGATWGSETALTDELYARKGLWMTPRFASYPTVSNLVYTAVGTVYHRQLLAYA
jgi:hypothetical protein